MSVTYVGQTAFQQVSESMPRKNPWGVDEMTVRWQGARFRLALFLASLQQGARSAEYRGMQLVSWSVDDNRVYPSVDLSYMGFLGNFPDATVDLSYMQQVVNKVAVVSGYQSVVREMVFYAPVKVSRYFSSQYHQTPIFPYSSSSGLPTGMPVLISSVIKVVDAEGNSIEYPGNAPSALVSATFVNVSVIVTDHKSTPVPPNILQIWSNETTTSITLV
jgi:hypothetical protein